MSFLEFDPHGVDGIPTIADIDPETNTTRLAWRILSQFAGTTIQEIPIATEFAEASAEYGSQMTPAINPLRKGRRLFFDQMPLIDGDLHLDPGMVALKVSHRSDDELERQAIFRLETHQDGPGVYYGESICPESRVGGIELDILWQKLLDIEQMFWWAVGQPSLRQDLDSQMNLFLLPRNSAFDGLEGMLDGLD